MGKKPHIKSRSKRIVITYLVFAVSYILFSGWVLNRMSLDEHTRQGIEQIKGVCFVLATALLLYVMLLGYDRRVNLAFAAREAGEHRLRLALEAGGQGCFEVDIVSGRFVVDELFALGLGYDLEAFRDETLETLRKRIHPEDADRVLAYYRGTAQELGREFRLQVRLRTRQGEWKHFLSHGRIIEWDAAGRPLRLLGAQKDISDLKAAEESLRSSEEKLQAIIQASPLAIATLDSSRRVRSWNPAAERMLGWTAREVLEAKLPLEFPDQARELERYAARVLAGETFAGIGASTRHRDGTTIELSLSAAPLHDRAGQITGLVAISQDVTAERRVAQALKVSEERFRTLVEACPDPIFIQAEGKFEYVNPAGLQLYGADTPEQLLGQSVLDRIYPAGREGIAQRIKLINESRQSAPKIETVWLRLNGEEVPVESFGAPLPGKVGGGALVFGRDLTERRRAQSALEESERRLRRAITFSPFPTMLHAEDGTVLQLSHSWCEISGYSQEELGTTRDWARLAYGPQAQLLETHIAGLYGLRGKVTEGDFHIRTRAGARRIWEFSSAPLGRLSDGRRLVISVAIDVTERRQAEDELCRLNVDLERRVSERTRELEASNKEMEAFSYSVSHDLRAPLRAIDAYGRILAAEHAAQIDAAGRHLLDVVITEAGRMRVLIDDLLTLSRLGRQSLRPQQISMDQMVDDLIRELRVRHPERRIEFVRENLPAAWGDASLLQRALVNLLDNAVKYTSRQPEARIEITASVSAEEQAFHIKDNGAGFDMRYKDKLFKVFQRLHPESEFEGTGVGLALVKRVVERHGGRVWAEGQLGQGATFSFSLPVPPGHP